MQCTFILLAAYQNICPGEGSLSGKPRCRHLAFNPAVILLRTFNISRAIIKASKGKKSFGIAFPVGLQILNRPYCPFHIANSEGAFHHNNQIVDREITCPVLRQYLIGFPLLADLIQAFPFP